MSGGSLDYLCYKDAGEINPEVLGEVVECLGRRGVGFAEAQVATMAVAGKLAEVGRLLEEVEASLGWVGLVVWVRFGRCGRRWSGSCLMTLVLRIRRRWFWSGWLNFGRGCCNV